MKHTCSICNKRVAKQYQDAHLEFHRKHPEKSKDSGMTERVALWLIHKQELKKH